MNIDPRLERLQTLIEQKRYQHGLSGNQRPVQVDDEIQDFPVSSNLPVKASRSRNDSPVSWRNEEAVQSSQTLVTENRVVSDRTPLSNNYALGKLSTSGSRVGQKPGEEHLGRHLDLYA